MKVINLTNNIEPLLGKVVLSCIPEIAPIIETDKIRIYYGLHKAIEKKGFPALLYGVNPAHEHWCKVWRLLTERKIGLLVADGDAELIYRETGRKVDGVLLYGDDRFWREVADYISNFTGVFSPETVLALTQLFKGHLASLRLFFGAFSVTDIIRNHKYGTIHISRETLISKWENILTNIRPYMCYPIPFKHWNFISWLMSRSNYEFILKMREKGIEITELANITKPLNFYVKIEMEPEKTELAYRLLRLLHPRAVEKGDEKTLVVSALF